MNKIELKKLLESSPTYRTLIIKKLVDSFNGIEALGHYGAVEIVKSNCITYNAKVGKLEIWTGICTG